MRSHERPFLVIPGGFEPPAPRLGIWCSIRLSYGTMPDKLAPPTHRVQPLDLFVTGKSATKER